MVGVGFSLIDSVVSSFLRRLVSSVVWSMVLSRLSDLTGVGSVLMVCRLLDEAEHEDELGLLFLLLSCETVETLLLLLVLASLLFFNLLIVASNDEVSLYFKLFTLFILVCDEVVADEEDAALDDG